MGYDDILGEKKEITEDGKPKKGFQLQPKPVTSMKREPERYDPKCGGCGFPVDNCDCEDF